VSRAIRRHYAASGATHDVDVSFADGRLEGHVDGRAVSADARVVRAFEGGAALVVSHEGGRARAVVVRDGDVVHVAMRGRVFRFKAVAARQEADARAADGAETFAASPMTGVVRQVVAEPGRSHAAGETLAVVEAMKMEFAVLAPRAVVVEEVRAKTGDRVEIGQVLVTFAEAAKCPA
jgi:acetyl/propionyl-CoA carboxylase alpha subunit